MKKVAIITRTKNRNLTLQRTMQSIINQIFKDFVWVVVNDGGEISAINQIVYDAQSSGIDTLVIQNETSLGMEAASNIGIKNSKSKYIVILDDDDTWHPEFLNKTVSFLENEENQIYKGVVTRTTLIEEKILDDKTVFSKSYPFNPELENISLFSLARKNLFSNLSLLYHREALEITGLYREDFPVYGDWEFNLRFVRHFKIWVIPEYLSNYHIRTNKAHQNYINTVALRDKWYNIIKDELLKDDLNSNVIDIGFLINIGHEINQLERTIKRGSILWTIRKLFNIK